MNLQIVTKPQPLKVDADGDVYQVLVLPAGLSILNAAARDVGPDYDWRVGLDDTMTSMPWFEAVARRCLVSVESVTGPDGTPVVFEVDGVALEGEALCELILERDLKSHITISVSGRAMALASWPSSKPDEAEPAKTPAAEPAAAAA